MAIKLSDYSTDAPKGVDEQKIRDKTKELAKEIAALQYDLYKESKQALLVIFQGMDASGKDGSTRNVFRYCGPTGISAHSFKKPTDLEFSHDFLWRVNKITPAKGEITIFNRSHYEDILIQRVHGWIDNKRAKARIDAINAWETLLTKDNNTRILKFYMHISPERQLEKLQERIDDPTKNWKHKAQDWEERKLWDKYMKYYQEAINKCDAVPWIIAPVDQRWYRNYFVAEKVLKTLKAMKIKVPTGIEE
jgi:PPK2 family polyphosphate:nucleotide phosphotransferase